MKAPRKRPNFPRFLATSTTGISLIVWDTDIPENDAIQATSEIELEVDSVNNANQRAVVHFKEDRASHLELGTFVSQLNAKFDYDTAQVTTYSKEWSAFQRLVSDSTDYTFTTRTYVVTKRSGRTPTENDVGNVFANLTEVINLGSTNDRVIFGTHVVFLNHADQAIKKLGINNDELVYTGKLLEVENEIIGGT